MASGVSRPMPVCRCSLLYQGKKSWQKLRESSMLPKAMSYLVPELFVAGIALSNQLGKVCKRLVPVSCPGIICEVISLGMHRLTKGKKIFIPGHVSEQGAHLLLRIAPSKVFLRNLSSLFQLIGRQGCCDLTQSIQMLPHHPSMHHLHRLRHL